MHEFVTVKWDSVSHTLRRVYNDVNAFGEKLKIRNARLIKTRKCLNFKFVASHNCVSNVLMAAFKVVLDNDIKTLHEGFHVNVKNRWKH